MATELTDIELDEISLVDKGDDPEARIALFKRDETNPSDEKDPPVINPGFLQTLRDVLKGDAQSFEDVLGENDARRQVMESMDKLWEMVHALQGSVESIMTDDEVTDKRAAVQASLEQFSEALRGVVPSTKGIDTDDTAGDDSMSDEALEQKVEELTKRLDDEIVAHKAAQDELEKLRADSDDDDDDVTKGLPEEVRKRLETQEAEIAKLRDEREVEMVQKHLGEIAKSVPGVTAEPFVSGYRGLDENGREAFDVVLKGAAEAHAQLQKEIGKDGEGPSGSAYDRATEMAQKLMADKPSEYSTLYKARAHVWKMHPELKAEYAAERSQAH